MSLELVRNQRGASRHVTTPRLPAIARDPIDDAKEVLAAFSRKQDGKLDVPYADIAEDLAAALRTVLAILTRPAPKPVLRPWTRLQVEQARQFVMGLDVATAGRDPLKAMFLLGRCAEHCQALLDVIDAVAP